MQAYGGFVFSEDDIRHLELRIRNGLPFGVNHDPRITSTVTLLNTALRTDDDGYLGVWVTIEVDQDEWIENNWNSLSGFSPTITRNIFGGSAVTPSVIIGADAHWFSDDQIREACRAMSEHELTTCGRRIYQFADLPRAIVDLVVSQAPNLSSAILGSYIYESLKHFVHRLSSGNSQPVQSEFIITVVDSDLGMTTTAYLKTSSKKILRHAMDNLPLILSRGGNYDYSQENGRWEDRDSR